MTTATTEHPQTEYILQTASAKMPSSCWGRYRKLAIIEVEKGAIPKMISERAKGVVSIYAVYDRLHVGKTERSEYYRQLKKAKVLCDKLNKERTVQC